MADELVKNTEPSRYECVRDGEVIGYATYRDGEVIGYATYRDAGGVVTLPHTYVEPAFRGGEVASRIVQFALDDIREQGKRVDPACPYVARWLRRHPDYADLLEDAAG